MAGTETGMESSVMRRIIGGATAQNPANFAFGQGKNAAIALLIIDKMKAPKACEKLMLERFPDAKNTRLGTVVGDPATGMATFKVNRAITGVAKRLLLTLKGTGFKKVSIVLEDGTPVEGAVGEDDLTAEPGQTSEPATEAAADPAAAAATPELADRAKRAELEQSLRKLMMRIPDASAADPAKKGVLLKLAAEATETLKTDLDGGQAKITVLGKALDAPPGTFKAPMPPGVPKPPPGPATEAKPDRAALIKSLTELAGRIPAAVAADAALKATLGKMATDANVNIKTNNLSYAAVSIEQLRRALDAAEEARAKAPEPGAGKGEAPAQPQQQAPDEGQALAKELTDLEGRMKAAIAIDPDLKGVLGNLVSLANAALKAKEFGTASKLIADLHRALEFAEQEPEQPALDLGALGTRLTTAQLRGLMLPDQKQFLHLVTQAASALSAEDAESATVVIDQLEALLESAERAQAAADEIADATSEFGVGAVQMAKLRLHLRAVEAGRGVAMSQLQAAGTEILENDFEGDPRQPQAEAALANVAKTMPKPSPELIKAIDMIVDERDRAAQAKARATALQEIKRYRDAIDAEPLLRELEETPYGNYRIHGLITDSLAQLEATLRA